MESLTLAPVSRVEGSVEPPGSKSISNRALPLAALASGTTRVLNLPDGEDVELMRKALEALGVPLAGTLKALSVQGRGRGFESDSPVDLFLGNSGTTTRTLTALLAAGRGEFLVRGVPRMHERPIGDLVDALKPLAGGLAAGATPGVIPAGDPAGGPVDIAAALASFLGGTQIIYAGKPGFPPLRILAKGLKGGRTRIKGDISSQFLTGLLLAMPLCEGPVEVDVDGVLVSAPYVDLTLKVMEAFGVTVENRDFCSFRLEKPAGYRSPGDYRVEPDASSASYFLAAGAIAGGTVKVEGLGRGSLQGEARFATVLERMGARVEYGPDSISVSKAALKGVDADMDEMSDTGMTLAMAALFAEGPTTIRNIGNWRVKETDRIAAMAAELRKVGATVEEGADSLVIHPPAAFRAAAIDTYDDHRIAMCFSLASLGGVPITIKDPGCTRKTYPGYFDAFRALAGGRP
jgi:3-phosphoshikimate 1-carboxyvinyltransferase